MPSKDAKRYLENWQGEVDSAARYRVLARIEKSPQLSQVYDNLAKTEEDHVAFWEGILRKAGAKIPPRKPSWRARVLMALATRFGPGLVLSTIAAEEKTNRNLYAPQKEAQGTGLVSDEHSHDRLLGAIINTQRQGASISYLFRIEGRHKTVGQNTLRAAIMGANDGLCSNLGLVMGVAGARFDSHLLMLTGLAGLLAGACSMALGEWISVTSARELADREIRIESEELEQDPEGEEQELRLIYEAKGMDKQEAESLARHMLSDKDRAMDALIREELGMDPENKGGSPMAAAVYSFVLFSIGAFIPVFPFLIAKGGPAVAASLVLSAAALFATGALGTLFTGRSVWFAGTRQLVLGLLAAGLTFTLGHLIGAGLS